LAKMSKTLGLVVGLVGLVLCLYALVLVLPDFIYRAMVWSEAARRLGRVIDPWKAADAEGGFVIRIAGSVVAGLVLIVFGLLLRRQATGAPEVKAAETAQVMPKTEPSMMFCRECGAKITRDSKFCKECGKSQA